MKKILSCFSIVLLVTTGLLFAEPQNFNVTLKRLQQYHDDGAYALDIRRVTDTARRYLQSRLKEKRQGQKLAIMVDIDETALSNYPQIFAWYNGVNNVGDSLSQSQLAVLTDSFNDKPIKPVLSLYDFAIKNGVAVFFVTGRTWNDQSGTISNLKSAGYDKGWSALVLRQRDQLHLSASKYKAQYAKQIKQQGYDLVLAMGDQFSDLPQAYADKVFKIPNPYYFIA
jgi:predicted secreted acid phosphatase